MGFKVFPAILWLSVLTYTAIAMPTFRADLTDGSYYIQSGSEITWHKDLNDPAGSQPCDMQGIIRIPFSSTTCYRVEFTFNNNEPSGFNFHFGNGCGDGWGGTPGCYEVHNKEKKVVVYPKTGSGSSSSFPDIVTSDNDVKIESGSVTIINGDGTEENVRHSTLFAPGNVYLSMNRVWDLTRYPNPPRVGTGLCSVRIYTC